MLASISLGILLVRSEAFHLHDNLLLLSIISKNSESGGGKSQAKRQGGEDLASEKPVCSFD